MQIADGLTTDLKLDDSVLNKCDFFTALKNTDSTFRIVGTADVELEGHEKHGAIVVIERAVIHADILSTGEKVFRVIIPNDEKLSVSLVSKRIQDIADDETEVIHNASTC